jgi:uncharacterized membrane protein
MATTLWEIGLIIVGGIVGAAAPILLKKGMDQVNKFNWNLIFNKYLIVGIGIFGLSYIIGIPAFKGGDVSVLYPFVSLGYVWVAMLSIKYLGEKMNLIKWLGILFILIGVSFIGFGR